jgi:menaquinone-dependent protoporphyrinogen oxidase
MRVLIAAASRHGSTTEIAQTIAEDLRAHDIEAEYFDIAEVGSPAGYDAIVVGSAVYAGRWLGEARDFLKRHRDALSTRPVWLFSSGPLGADSHGSAISKPTEQGLINLVGARGHQTFAGKLEREDLSRTERLVVRMVHAPLGDYREWETVHAWSDEIAGELGGVESRETSPTVPETITRT